MQTFNGVSESDMELIYIWIKTGCHSHNLHLETGQFSALYRMKKLADRGYLRYEPKEHEYVLLPEMDIAYDEYTRYLKQKEDRIFRERIHFILPNLISGLAAIFAALALILQVLDLLLKT